MYAPLVDMDHRPLRRAPRIGRVVVTRRAQRRVCTLQTGKASLLRRDKRGCASGRTHIIVVDQMQGGVLPAADVSGKGARHKRRKL